MQTDSSSTPDSPDASAYAPLQRTWEQLRSEVARFVIGQDDLIEQLFIALLAEGHCLVTGMPGMAKALSAAMFSEALGLSFYRIRCSPDLSPNDVVTDHFLVPDGQETEPLPADLMSANILLVDGIERLQPKTLSLVHHALQDRALLVRGVHHQYPIPFMVLASSYPQDDDTAELPAELRDDRFMFQIRVDYPSYHDEYQVAKETTTHPAEPIQPLATAEQLADYQQLARAPHMPPHTIHYALRLVRSTRVHEGENPDFVYEWVASGAGPRAVHYLTRAAKARAAINGRAVVGTKDIQAMAPPVLRHRVLTNRNAKSTGITVERVINRLLSDVPERFEGDDQPARAGEPIDPQDWFSSEMPNW